MKSGFSSTFSPPLRRKLRGGAAVALFALGLGLQQFSPALAEENNPVWSYSGQDSSTKQDSSNKAGETTLRNIKISYPGGESVLTIKRITAKGLSEDASGLSAKNIQLKDIKLTLRAARIEIPQLELKNVAFPALTPASLSATSETGKLPSLFAWLLASSAESVTAPDIRIGSLPPSTKVGVAFRDISIAGVEKGRIAEFGYGSFSSLPQPKAMGTGRASIKGLDLGLIATWFDDALAASSSPGLKPLYAKVEINDFRSSASQVQIKSITSTNFELAPPSMKPSEIAAILWQSGDRGGDKAEILKKRIQLLQESQNRIRIADIEYRGLSGLDKSGKPATIGLLRAEAIEPTRIGELRMGDMTFIHDTDGPIHIGSVALRGFAAAMSDDTYSRLASGEQFKDLPASSLPKLRFETFTIVDVKGNMPDKGPLSLGGFSVDARDWVGFLPSTLDIRIDNLNTPLGATEDKEVIENLQKAGMSSLVSNYGLKLSWREEGGVLTIAQSSNIDQMGQFKANIVLGDIPKYVLLDPSSNYPFLASARLHEISAALHLEPAMVKLAEMGLAKSATTRAELVQKWNAVAAKRLPAVIGEVNAAKINEGVSTFLTNLGSLAITITTGKPFTVMPIIFSKDHSLPKDVKDSLVVSVEAK